MNITFFELELWEKEFFEKNLKVHKLNFVNGHLDQKILPQIKDTELLVVFIYSHIDQKIISKLPKLKAIATMSTGFDHINLTDCKKKKIAVSNVPAYGDNTVAEHAFALILALSRKIVESVERTRKGSFSFEGLRGFDLKGRTIGVIGTGRIGRCVVQIAKGFGMNVLATDAFPNKEFSKQMNFKYVPLNNLLSNSDVITLHTPYTKETHHLINMNNVKKIKKGAVLINTARGRLVETHSLLYALDNEILSAAGLDVLEEECEIKEEKQLLSKIYQRSCNIATLLEEHMLLEHDNVLITPHNAFNSKEAIQRILDTTLENVKGFVNKKAVNLVK
jgi:D-lactate dehydrogenase